MHKMSLDYLGSLNSRLRCVVRGKRVAAEQACEESEAGHVVCVVPQLVGGGGGMSVSFMRVYVVLPLACVCI
jgi:hypothetical protein